MQLATSGYSNKRNPAGLGLTVVVHAGLAALAITGLHIAPPPAPPPPIVSTNIPDPPKPLPRAADPMIVDQRVAVDVVKPVVETADPPAADKTAADPGLARDPGTGGTVTGGDAVVETVKPLPGITRSAAIDPRYRADFEAPYPPASRRMGEAGTVLVRVVVGVDGHVVSAVVARSSGFARLDAAALKQALAKWRFVPALSDGHPVEAEREIPVSFRLEG